MNILLRGLSGLAVSMLALYPATAAVTISTASTENMSCANGVCTPTAKNAVLNVTDLTNLLASGNVTVNTGSGQLARHVEDIFVDAGFSWTSASGLTLDAYRSITVKQPVSVTGTAGVVLTTNDGGTNGYLSFISNGSLSFFATSNSLTIDGTAYTLVNSLSSLASAVAANPGGAYAFASNYDASQDGTYSLSPVQTTFTGNFQGLGNTISNISIANVPSKTESIGGLFAEVNGGTVGNIGVSGLNIDARGAFNAGGLVGGNISGFLYSDHVAGRLRKGHGPGGLVGDNGGVVYNSYASVSVRSSHGGGGLVADNNGTISGCFATGAVKGGSQSGDGGLVGANSGAILNSYATAAVTGGTSSVVGGLVAEVNEGSVGTSYATGAVSGGSRSIVGGFAGLNNANGAFSNSYWDTTTSGTDVGVGRGVNSGVTGLTTQQLQAGLPAGFDPAIWAEDPKINHGFPYLIANPPPK